MKIAYNLTAEDFLEFNLYTASKSEINIKKQRNGMIILLVMIAIMSVYLIVDKNYETLIYPALLAITVLFFYKKFFKWKLKSGYKKYVASVHADQLDKEESIEIKKKSIYIKNQSGEGSIENNDVVELIEISTLFMLLLKSGTSIVIPKRDLENEAELTASIKNSGINFRQELDWKW
jgi:hypothetical protein